MRRFAGAAIVAILACGVVEVAFGTGVAVGPSQQRAGAPGRGAAAAPALTVDPMWPKPLPSGLILGSVTGVAVDSQDHIWIVHRGGPSLTQGTENGLGTDPPTAELCCKPAPPVLEFDQAGNLVELVGRSGQRL